MIFVRKPKNYVSGNLLAYDPSSGELVDSGGTGGGGGGGGDLPSMGGQSGKFLSNNGSSALWTLLSSGDIPDLSGSYVTRIGGEIDGDLDAQGNAFNNVSAVNAQDDATTTMLLGFAASTGAYAQFFGNSAGDADQHGSAEFVISNQPIGPYFIDRVAKFRLASYDGDTWTQLFNVGSDGTIDVFDGRIVNLAQASGESTARLMFNAEDGAVLAIGDSLAALQSFVRVRPDPLAEAEYLAELGLIVSGEVLGVQVSTSLSEVKLCGSGGAYIALGSASKIEIGTVGSFFLDAGNLVMSSSTEAKLVAPGAYLALNGGGGGLSAVGSRVLLTATYGDAKIYGANKTQIEAGTNVLIQQQVRVDTDGSVTIGFSQDGPYAQDCTTRFFRVQRYNGDWLTMNDELGFGVGTGQTNVVLRDPYTRKSSYGADVTPPGGWPNVVEFQVPYAVDPQAYARLDWNDTLGFYVTPGAYNGSTFDTEYWKLYAATGYDWRLAHQQADGSHVYELRFNSVGSPSELAAKEPEIYIDDDSHGDYFGYAFSETSYACVFIAHLGVAGRGDGIADCLHVADNKVTLRTHGNIWLQTSADIFRVDTGRAFFAMGNVPDSGDTTPYAGSDYEVTLRNTSVGGEVRIEGTDAIRVSLGNLSGQGGNVGDHGRISIDIHGVIMMTGKAGVLFPSYDSASYQFAINYQALRQGLIVYDLQTANLVMFDAYNSQWSRFITQNQSTGAINWYNGVKLPDFSSVFSPVEGMIAWDYTNHYQVNYNGSGWVNLSGD